MRGKAQYVYYGARPLIARRDTVAVAAEIHLCEVGERRRLGKPELAAQANQ